MCQMGGVSLFKTLRVPSPRSKRSEIQSGTVLYLFGSCVFVVQNLRNICLPVKSAERVHCECESLSVCGRENAHNVALVYDSLHSR